MDKYKDNPIINDAFEVIGEYFQKTQQEIAVLHDAHHLHCQQVEHYQAEITEIRQESQAHWNELILLRDQNQSYHGQISELAAVIDSLHQQLKEVQRDNQHLKEALSTQSTRPPTSQDLPNSTTLEEVLESSEFAATAQREEFSAQLAAKAAQIKAVRKARIEAKNQQKSQLKSETPVQPKIKAPVPAVVVAPQVIEDPGFTDRTQFMGQDPQGQKQQVVIGLDFGTAFTKVVIGVRGVHYAVPFGAYAHPENIYLLPSAFTVAGSQERCVLDAAQTLGLRIDELKMRLINRDFSLESKVHSVAFLALVLRWVRGWFLKAQYDTYRDRYLVWLVNVGLPTDSYSDEPLVKMYRNFVEIAWTTSVLPGPITLERIREGLRDQTGSPPPTITDRLLDQQLITPFPEFVAQVAGYVRSPRRQEGLHTLIDIGAGTLDVTTFNVFQRDGEDYFPIFARGVEPLGTQFLIQHRLTNAPRVGAWNPSSFDPVPSDDEFLKKLALSTQQLQELDAPFRTKVSSLYRGKIQLTKQKGNPNASHFDTGVPTFLCGGGGKVSWYSGQFQPLEQARPPFKIVITSIALPDTLNAPGIQKATYDRLSVAYGLSHNPDDLGEIALMGKDFEPVSRQPTRLSSYSDHYVDKDMV